MKNIGQMLKQAQQMQTRMQEMQAKMEELVVTGQAGAGLVTLELNGRHELKRVKLTREVVSPDDVEMLEDLLVAAHNDARQKIEAALAEETQKMMGGMKLPPGVKLPF